mmetsp:Transcript_171559/g.545051  ORF Transcript_171559/g.545051 Transcript_171559/m.545051 type:complete len:80 (+) Transcript_171559:108-347(+)
MYEEHFYATWFRVLSPPSSRHSECLGQGNVAASTTTSTTEARVSNGGTTFGTSFRCCSGGCRMAAKEQQLWAMTLLQLS